MKIIKLTFLLIFCANLCNSSVAQNNYSAKKLYREFSKYEQFKEAQIPKFVIAAARMFIKNDDVNSLLKTVQKSKVISISNPKYNSISKQVFTGFSSKLNPQHYKPLASKSKNMKIFSKTKNNFVREIAILNKTGPTLHYILVKGKLRKDEAEKFTKNLNNLGVNVDVLKDKILGELDKILNKKENTSQPKVN